MIYEELNSIKIEIYLLINLDKHDSLSHNLIFYQYQSNIVFFSLYLCAISYSIIDFLSVLIDNRFVLFKSILSFRSINRK